MREYERGSRSVGPESSGRDIPEVENTSGRSDLLLPGFLVPVQEAETVVRHDAILKRRNF